MLLLMSN